MQVLAATTVEIANNDMLPDVVMDKVADGFIRPLVATMARCGPHLLRAKWKVVIEGNHGYVESGVFAHAFRRNAPRGTTLEFTRYNDNPACKIGLNTTKELKVILYTYIHTSKHTQENAVCMLINFINKSAFFFDTNFFGNKALFIDQLLRMRRVRIGKDDQNVRQPTYAAHTQAPTYSINGKIPSKQCEDKNDDIAMAALFAIYDSCMHFAIGA